MGKGIIYYTDNRLGEPIFSTVQEQIRKAGLPITSVSLKPIDFGDNTVLDLKPGVLTILRQILVALEASTADVVFFCEHDVLYHPSHFDFEPQDDVFYYNTNVWQWQYPKDRAVTYDFIRSLSNLCVKRQLAIKQYKQRLKMVEENGWKNERSLSVWARRMGFEPGTKSKRQELISESNSECWRSEYPNIDIRHKKTFTPAKMKLKNFKHKPINWREISLKQIPGWNYQYLSQVGAKSS